MLSGSLNSPHYYVYGRRLYAACSILSAYLSQLLTPPIQRLLRTVPHPLLLLVAIECFWIIFDRNVTSQVRFAPKRPYIRPTESSPLSPYYRPPYDEYYNGPTRAFPMRPFPCQSLSMESRFQNPGEVLKTGFIFLMQPQVASTTLATVTSRIARNVARRTRPESLTFNQTACASWTAPVKAKRFKGRIREKSFLWTFVREPVDRLVSKFFHTTVSIEGKEPTLENFQAFVQASGYQEYASYLKTMTLRRYINPQRSDLMPSMIQEILDGYDFVGVMERMEESLAVLQLLLGLETQDMLYLLTRSTTTTSRDGGGPLYFPMMRKTPPLVKQCIQLQPRQQMTLPWKEFLHRPYLYEEVFEPDVYLYRAMNASLDATIDSLGRDKVQQAVRQLVWAENQATLHCESRAVYPCSAQGELQEAIDCFVNDVGCGSLCLDSFGRELHKNADFLQVT